MPIRNGVIGLPLTGIRTLVCLFAVMSFAACEEEGPAEQAGEKVDEGIEEMGELLEPDGPVEQAIDNASDSLEDAADEVKKSVD